MTGSKILRVSPVSCDQDAIEKAASFIKKGGLVVFPTSSFYGLGADAFRADAVESVFQVKKRDPQRPVLILIAALPDLAPLVQSIPRVATRLMAAFWPGSLTLVFEAADPLPPNLTGHSGKIGVRLASHPVALCLIRTVGNPITGTSANLSGKHGCTEVELLPPLIRDHVDVILDAGLLQGGKGSSVVDVTVDPPRVIREGAVPAEKIAATLGFEQHILF
jgi:L-threonylcarbamoyladenylate synthase